MDWFEIKLDAVRGLSDTEVSAQHCLDTSTFNINNIIIRIINYNIIINC